MRSYKDCLIEYIEERGAAELSASWFHYLKNELRVDAHSFQILESTPPVENLLDFNLYADIIPSDNLVYRFQVLNHKRRSSVYKNLIQRLLIGELKRLQSKEHKQPFNLKMFEDMLKYVRSKEYNSYSKAFKRCLLNSGFDKEFIKSFFIELEEDQSNCFKAIEKFYNSNNYHLNIPKYGVQSTTALVGTLAVHFDSHCLYQGTENEWTEQTVIPNSSFILGEDSSLFSNINSKAKISPVKVSGELQNIEKTEIRIGNWFDEKMVEQLFKNNKCFDSRLEFSFKQKTKSLLKKRFESFYSFREYDLTVEVQNQFTDQEIQVLRNNSFSLFPLHLSNEHKCYKWIDKNEKGELRIRIKSKGSQQTFFGADLKTIIV